jgi:hypothetical protein
MKTAYGKNTNSHCRWISVVSSPKELAASESPFFGHVKAITTGYDVK